MFVDAEKIYGKLLDKAVSAAFECIGYDVTLCADGRTYIYIHMTPPTHWTRTGAPMASCPDIFLKDLGAIKCVRLVGRINWSICQSTVFSDKISGHIHMYIW